MDDKLLNLSGNSFNAQEDFLICNRCGIKGDLSYPVYFVSDGTYFQNVTTIPTYIKSLVG